MKKTNLDHQAQRDREYHDKHTPSQRENEHTLRWIATTLVNDEASCDQDLQEHFEANNISPEAARFYISQRNDALKHGLTFNLKPFSEQWTPERIEHCIEQTKSLDTPLGQHVSDGMPPLRGPSAKHSPRDWGLWSRPSLITRIENLELYCDKLRNNAHKSAIALAKAERLADALKRQLDWIDAGCDPSRKSLEASRAALADWNAPESPADADALEALDQLEQKQEQAQ